MGESQVTDAQLPPREAGDAEAVFSVATSTRNVPPSDRTVEQTVAEKPKSKLETVQTGVTILTSIATTIAIIAGGWWTWTHFDNTASLKPNLVISESVKATRLTDSMVYLFISISLQNTSQRTLYEPAP